MKGHHVYLKTNLPKLSELVTTIMRVHGRSNPELFLVHRLFHELKIECDQHNVQEEMLLFPEFRDRAPKEEYTEVLDVVKTGLAAIVELLKKLRDVTNQYEAPADGCGTYHLTFGQLAELEADLLQHLALEKDLFTRFE